MKGDIATCLKRSSISDVPDKFDGEDLDFWRKCDKGFEKMIDFLKDLTQETKVIQIVDLEGKMSIGETKLAVKKELYPILRQWADEGRIVRDRQV